LTAFRFPPDPPNAIMDRALDATLRKIFLFLSLVKKFRIMFTQISNSIYCSSQNLNILYVCTFIYSSIIIGQSNSTPSISLGKRYARPLRAFRKLAGAIITARYPHHRRHKDDLEKRRQIGHEPLFDRPLVSNRRQGRGQALTFLRAYGSHLSALTQKNKRASLVGHAKNAIPR